MSNTMVLNRITNSTTFCFVFVYALSAATSAFGQPKFVASNFQFERIPPPATLTWQLATAAGEHVDLTISGIQPMLGGQQIVRLITEEQAPTFGLDWQAWSAAVNNPAYNRSIMSWGNMTKEQPFENRFTPFRLDRIGVLIMEWEWPPTPLSSPVVRIQAELLDLSSVPEPATWVPALIGIMLIACSSGRR